MQTPKLALVLLKLRLKTRAKGNTAPKDDKLNMAVGQKSPCFPYS
jgi:hypothetical protein